jgi:signal transduction histidine kinase
LPASRQEAQLRPRVRVLEPTRLPDQVELAAYYVVAEALTNTAKHAAASVLDVEVSAADSVLQVCVRDDGRGGADVGGGSGLVGLTDRIEALGGRLTVSSPVGTGTTVRAAIPLAVADPATAPDGGPEGAPAGSPS